jgi:hypothetical protein
MVSVGGSGSGDGVPDFGHGVRFVRAPESLWRDLPGVSLVRTVEDPEVVELWGSGVLVWAALVEPVTAIELAFDLAAVLGAPLDVVGRDVDTALTDLVHRGVAMRLDEA